jgi:hypothetical protein
MNYFKQHFTYISFLIILFILIGLVFYNNNSRIEQKLRVYKRDISQSEPILVIEDFNFNYSNDTNINSTSHLIVDYCKQICLPCLNNNNTLNENENTNITTNKYLGANLENNCYLKRVGIPLYNAMIQGFKYGAYLKDPMPRKKGFAEKIWLTFGYLSNI